MLLHVYRYINMQIYSLVLNVHTDFDTAIEAQCSTVAR